jgi:predicted ATPase
MSTKKTSLEFKCFAINKLFGFYNYSLTFIDNKLVIVGENGTNKTTILNLFFYVITQQWHKLLEYEFESLELTLNKPSESWVIEYSELKTIDTKKVKQKIRIYTGWPSSKVNSFLRDYYTYHREYYTYGEKNIKHLCKLYGPSSEELIEILDRETLIWDMDKPYPVVKSITKVFSGWSTPVLHMPTYRRLEKSLLSIDDEENYLRRRDYGERYLRRKGLNRQMTLFEEDDKESFISFQSVCESGMQDVEQKLNNLIRSIDLQRKRDIEEAFKLSLSSLVTSKAEEENQRIKLLEKKQYIASFKTAQPKLSDKVDTIVRKLEKSEKLDDIDNIIISNLSNYIKVEEKYSKNKHVLTTFVDTCNKYFSGKKFELTATETKEIELKLISGMIDNKILELEHLSSGEKQMVSLFTYLILDSKKVFLIIDEPELSLSVPWQEQFLQDISGYCDGMLVATHSPFIFDNAVIEPYTFPLASFSNINRKLENA